MIRRILLMLPALLLMGCAATSGAIEETGAKMLAITEKVQALQLAMASGATEEEVAAINTDIADLREDLAAAPAALKAAVKEDMEGTKNGVLGLGTGGDVTGLVTLLGLIGAFVTNRQKKTKEETKRELHQERDNNRLARHEPVGTTPSA